MATVLSLCTHGNVTHRQAQGRCPVGCGPDAAADGGNASPLLHVRQWRQLVAADTQLSAYLRACGRKEGGRERASEQTQQ